MTYRRVVDTITGHGRGDDEHPRDAPAQVDRRTAVVGGTAALVGLGVLGAGCASAGDSSGGSTVDSTSAASAAAPPGTDLGKAAEVPVGGGTVFTAAKVVVTQQTAGAYVALSAVCTHQGCLVNDVSGGTINCPCHGSQYHLDGSVARGPSTTPLAPRAVTAAGGNLILS